MKPARELSDKCEPGGPRYPWYRWSCERSAFFVLPSGVGFTVAWRTFSALDDPLLSLTLGLVAFTTLTPVVAAMSARHSVASDRHR